MNSDNNISEFTIVSPRSSHLRIYLTQQIKPLKKPILRGVSHQISAFVATAFGIYLLAKTNHNQVFWGNLIYIISVVFLFGVSAIYHRPNWSPEKRKILRRIDHAAIYFLIAGTYTPIILFAFPRQDVDFYLILIWSSALAGVAKSIFWPAAPKYLVALLCVLLGWVVVIEWNSLVVHFSKVQLRLLFGGGVAYTVGAVIYAAKWPNPSPRIFGYHEIFHALTIVAAILHAVLIFQITAR